MKNLMQYCNQSQAAAFAVLCADIRENLPDSASEPNEAERTALLEIERQLREMEEAAIDSIQANDGEVVYWLRLASEAMKPVLNS